MDESELKIKLEQVFIEQFGKENFKWEKTQEQYERWDSLAHMELVSQVEKVFGVQFELDEVLAITKPQNFLEQLTKKLEAK